MAIPVKGLLTEVQAMELIGKGGRQCDPRESRRLLGIRLGGGRTLTTDRPQRSRWNPGKFLVMPRLAELGTDIDLPAFKLTGEMNGLQLIFEIRRFRELFLARAGSRAQKSD